MLVCGKLGDLFGHRLIFRIGLRSPAFGCAACAAAPDWPLVPVGAGGAGRRHGAGALLRAGARHLGLSAEQRPAGAGRLRRMAMLLAAAVGPLLGGALVELWGWPAVYWVRVPVALLALALSGHAAVAEAATRGRSTRWARCCWPSCMSAFLLALCPVAARRACRAGWRRCLPWFWRGARCGFYVIGEHASCPSRSSGQPCSPMRPSAVPNIMNVLANLAGFADPAADAITTRSTCCKLSALTSGWHAGASPSPAVRPAPRWQRGSCRRLGRRPTAFAGVALVGLWLLPLEPPATRHRRWWWLLLLVGEGVGQGLLAVAYIGPGDRYPAGARPWACAGQPVAADPHARHRERRHGR